MILRCALCGADSQQNVLSSTSFFGPRDLDMRPNGPARWALQFMVQRCPACGYCAERIGELTGGAGAVVASLIYRDVLDNARMPELARRYFCAALVAEADERRGDSARRFIDAAWACDDDGAAEQARICRERAAEMLSSAIEWGDVPTESPVVHGVRADLLRRAGRYDDAIEAVSAGEVKLDLDDENCSGAATVLGFIRELAEAGDDGPHSVAEAFASEE